MRRTVGALAMALGLSIFMVAAVFAWEDRLGGPPSNLVAGQSFGVFVWVGDEGGLHLRTSAIRDYDHHFSGTITTDGEIYDLHFDNAGDDSAYVGPSRHTLTYSFHTYDGEDGIDYRISGGTYQSVSAFDQGNRMEVRNIYIGANGVNPEFNPFTDSR